MPLIERDITLTCVSNDVGGPYVGGARWLGVRLTDLLDRAGVGGTGRPDPEHRRRRDDDQHPARPGHRRPGRDDRDRHERRGPPPRARLPGAAGVPGLYGFISATKWLTRLTLTTYAEQDAYWTERDWATDAPIKISSRIDTPKSFDEIDAGDTFIGGVAWAQHRGIDKVEVQVDGGAWQQAELGPSAGDDYWRQWYLPWKAESGEHDAAGPRDHQGRRGADRRQGLAVPRGLQRPPARSSSRRRPESRRPRRSGQSGRAPAPNTR